MFLSFEGVFVLLSANGHITFMMALIQHLVYFQILYWRLSGAKDTGCYNVVEYVVDDSFAVVLVPWVRRQTYSLRCTEYDVCCMWFSKEHVCLVPNTTIYITRVTFGFVLLFFIAENTETFQPVHHGSERDGGWKPGMSTLHHG